jgi:thioredoxin reductase
VRNEKTAILGNDVPGFDFARLISNWTKYVTLLTNGSSKLTPEQTKNLEEHEVDIIEKEIERLEHVGGVLQSIIFRDGTKFSVKTLYAPGPVELQCKIPEMLGTVLTEDGYVQVDAFQETSIPGVYACGDNSNRLRTLANAVATGTTAGMALSKKMILEEF